MAAQTNPHASPVAPWPAFAALFLLLLGGWLLWDLSRMRQHMLDEATATVVERSQVIGQTLAKSLLSADYVLRDVLDRITPADLRLPHPDPARAQALTQLLRQKVGPAKNLTH